MGENWDTGEFHLYGFLNNDGCNDFDFLGLQSGRNRRNKSRSTSSSSSGWKPRTPRRGGRGRRPRRNSPSSKTETASLGGVSDLIVGAIPKSYGAYYFDGRLAVVPFAPPLGSLEVVAFADGRVTCCLHKDGAKGGMFVGEIGLEVSAGIGTSIGGTSGVRANRKKNPYDGHRGYSGKDSEGRPRGAPRPTVFDSGNTSQTTTRNKVALGAGGDTPPCETTLTFGVKVGVSGFVSAGVGRFSVGAEFDKPMGGCSFPGGCDFSLSLSSSGGAVFGLGTGARLQAYGRGSGTGTIVLW